MLVTEERKSNVILGKIERVAEIASDCDKEFLEWLLVHYRESLIREGLREDLAWMQWAAASTLAGMTAEAR